MAEREFRFERKMTDAEAMMWHIEHDPRLSSNIGSIIICDQRLNFDALRRRVRVAVADIPRMRERVAPVLGRMSPPLWLPDPEFDVDFHLRRIALPAPGTDRQLYDLCTTLLQEPFDRTRPLWQFVVIDGLQGERGALFTKLHHTITDGEGAVRLAEHYMELEREAPLPPDVDLDEIIAAHTKRARTEERGGLVPSFLRTTEHTFRRFLGIGKRVLGEAALVATDPQRLLEGAANVRKAITSAQSQLSGGPAGSPLWTERSRHRRFDTLEVKLDDAKAAAKALGGSLNDFFVTGAAIGAYRYHEFNDTEAPYFNATFVVSTRNDATAGGNSFTPTKIRVPGGKGDPQDRFDYIKEAMGGRRGEVTGGADLMGAVSGLANLLPTSVVTGIARSQAGSIDFATSNVRGAPIEVFVSGGKVLRCYPMGPVAGTAWNITLMSYAGTLCMGVHSDPAAVADPDLLVRSLEDGYRELLSAGGRL